MINIQIASDLHIDYKNNNVPNPLDFINPSADILILAGDIGSFYKIDQLTEFLKALCIYFKIVLYVPGNHEWYTIPEQEPLNYDILEKRMYHIKNVIPNLYILNRSSVCIGNLCIAGTTLWTNPECQVPQFIVRVHGMKTREYQNKHNEDLTYLKKIINYCQKNKHKLLVVTHHPPTKRVIDTNKKKNKFPSLYATDLEYLLDKNKVNIWICGHVHKNFDFISENGCRVVGNQKGKNNQITDYSKEFVITV